MNTYNQNTNKTSFMINTYLFIFFFFHLWARLVDYLFPMSRPTLFLGPTLKKKKKKIFFTFRPTLSRGAFFSSENCILNEINKKSLNNLFLFVHCM